MTMKMNSKLVVRILTFLVLLTTNMRALCLTLPRQTKHGEEAGGRNTRGNAAGPVLHGSS